MFLTYFSRKYPLPVTNEEAMNYRKQCEKDFSRYNELRPDIEQVASRFDKLQHEMNRLENGTPEYQAHYRKVIDEYRKLVKIGYFEQRREYNECSQRNWFDDFFGQKSDFCNIKDYNELIKMRIN